LTDNVKERLRGRRL